MNCIQLIGRITHDLELKTTPSGKKFCSFSIAVQRKYKNKDTNEYEADFFNIRAWEARAEFVTKYFCKGQRVGISGTLQTRSYTDKNGNPATWYEVIAEGIDFADGKQENNGANNHPPKPQNTASQAAPSGSYTEPPQSDAPPIPNDGSFDDDDYPF